MNGVLAGLAVALVGCLVAELPVQVVPPGGIVGGLTEFLACLFEEVD